LELNRTQTWYLDLLLVLNALQPNTTLTLKIPVLSAPPGWQTLQRETDACHVLKVHIARVDQPTPAQRMAILSPIKTQPLVALQAHKHLLVLSRPLPNFQLSPTQQEGILQPEQLPLQRVLRATRVVAHQLLAVPRVVRSAQCRQVHVHHLTLATKLYRQAVVLLKQSAGALMAQAQPHVTSTRSAQVVLLLFVLLATIQIQVGIFA